MNPFPLAESLGFFLAVALAVSTVLGVALYGLQQLELVTAVARTDDPTAIEARLRRRPGAR